MPGVRQNSHVYNLPRYVVSLGKHVSKCNKGFERVGLQNKNLSRLFSAHVGSVQRLAFNVDLDTQFGERKLGGVPRVWVTKVTFTRDRSSELEQVRNR
jgi:hypothetical protein